MQRIVHVTALVAFTPRHGPHTVVKVAIALDELTTLTCGSSARVTAPSTGMAFQSSTPAGACAGVGPPFRPALVQLGLEGRGGHKACMDARLTGARGPPRVL